ncbi:hypothetical protein D9758_007360 [Tetrapyrgos nigripes]|uniref:Uncharacterized protein n=1 Tax=Tetrapyrgos nigripes TaxID=182062 RepID=A0A8H5GB96_9AGAR|nr:hypothetical protein D9758_007360 [Tetrapyrgos nigripes]
MMADSAGSVDITVVGQPNHLAKTLDAGEVDTQVHSPCSLSLGDTVYTTSELDNESNNGITITEPSVQDAAETIATVSIPQNHFDDLSVDQIKASSLLVATQCDPDSGRNITHVLQPEVFPQATTNGNNASANDPEQTVTSSPILRPHRTIRFRSRVRITSGVGKNHARHARRSSSDAGSASDIATSRAHLRSLTSLSPDWGGILPSGADSPRDSSTGATSRSNSVSSSISAPIRFREDEENSSGRPSKWGPLGRRVQMFVGQQKAAKQQKTQPANESGKGKRVILVYDPETWSYVPRAQSIPQNSSRDPDVHSEVSPLLGRGYRSYRARRFPSSGSNSSGGGSYDSHDGRYDSDNGWGPDTYEARLNQEIEKVFGTWPGRLLNRHVRADVLSYV